jgi:hypothetical protein
MRFISWITKATDTHSEYVILVAFPQQQWLRERSSILRLRTLPFLFFFQRSPPLARGLIWDSTVCWAKPRCANSLGEKKSFTVNFYIVLGELMMQTPAAVEVFRVYFNTSKFGKFLPSMFNYFQRHNSKLHWATCYCGVVIVFTQL